MIKNSTNRPTMMVLQVLSKSRLPLTTVQISSRMAKDYMPDDPTRRMINVYQTVHRLWLRKSVAREEIDNPLPTGTRDVMNAYTITAVGRRALAYLEELVA